MAHLADYLRRSTSKIRFLKWRTLFVFFFIFVTFWTIAFIAAGVHVASQVFDAQAHISHIKTALADLSFEEAKNEAQAAQEKLERARTLLPFIRSASWLPYLGSTVETSADVITSSELLLEAFSPVIDLGVDLMRLSGISEEYLQEVQDGLSPEVTFEDLSTETKRAVLSRLSASAGDLDLLLAELTILEEELVLLSQSTQVGPLLSVLDPLVEDLRAAREPLEILSIAARLLPDFAGLEEPSSILLVFMNNNELRPGGGFIGSYGVMEMFGGDIAHLETADVYTIDRDVEEQVTRTPPDPLTRYNAMSQWFFRDSNWSPDFAVSSMQSIELFLEEAAFLGEGSTVPATDDIDHLMAITPTYASDLLEIIGSITVGGQTFTADNIADLLEYQVQYGYSAAGIPEAQRKEILADLVNEMKSRLYALTAAQWPPVFEATMLALQEKQFLLYSTDEEVQSVLSKVGWAGSIDSSSVDRLMVVDANLASLKSDPAVKRDVTYEVYENASGQWVGRVSIHYNHTGTFDWKTTRYRTYTRVYMPMGTKLLNVEGSWLNDKTQNPTKAEGPVDVVDELGLTSFGTFTSVEPGEENTLSFEFALAPEIGTAIERGLYDLTVLKQAGAQNNALTIDLDFGKNVTHATPGEDSDEWGDDMYRLNTILDQDIEIHVEL